MARQPKSTTDSRAAQPPPQPGLADSGSVAPVAASSILTADEKLSPLFKSLRDIERIEDQDERLYAALDRLDNIGKLALSRSRTTGNGGVICDPDCHAAVKVEEVAHRLLGIEARPRKPRAPDLSVFGQPLALAKGA